MKEEEEEEEEEEEDSIAAKSIREALRDDMMLSQSKLYLYRGRKQSASSLK